MARANIGDTLCDAVAKWPGPSAGNFNDGEDLASFDGRKAELKAKGINGNGMGESLAIAAARTTAAAQPERARPAPAARDHKGSSAESTTRQDGKLRNDMLDWAAEQFFLPPSSPAPTTPPDGEPCSTASPNTNPPSVKRKLNPIFVEALMRWPTGLSGFERQETAWTRWWLLMPSLLCELVSSVPEPEQGSLF